MSDRFVVQVNRRTVGIAVRGPGGFRFFASEPDFFALEGRSYLSLRAVILAAEERAAASEPATAEPAAAPPAASRPAVPAAPRRAGGGPAAVPSRRLRPPRAGSGAEEAPDWFRWAFYLGLAATPALAGGLAAAVS